MKKFVFRVDVITDGSDIDVEQVCADLNNTVNGIGIYSATTAVKSVPMKEQGLKVWASRVMGVSLVEPKPAKVKATTQPETVEA